MPMTALPTPPSRSQSPAAFSASADSLLAALPTFVTEANTLETNVNAKEASATAQAATATTKAAEAAASATIASGAVATSGAVLWVSGTTYSIGNVVYSPINFANYRRKTNGAGTTDPSADGTNWSPINPARGWQWAGLADGAVLSVSSPQNNVISAAATVTLPDATTFAVGDQWHFETGANIVTIKYPSGLLCAANTASSGSGGLTLTAQSTDGQYASYGGVKRAPYVLATASVAGFDPDGLDGFGLIGGVGAVASKTDTVDHSVIPFTVTGTTVTTGTASAVTACASSGAGNPSSIALLSATRYIQATSLGSVLGLRFNLGSITANVAAKVGANVAVSSSATVSDALPFPAVSAVGAIAVYGDTAGDTVNAVGVIDNTTVAAAGTPITLKSGVTASIITASACKLATDKALAIYHSNTATTIYAAVLSLSGTSVTSGSEVTVTSAGGIGSAMGRCIQLSTDKALIVYSNTADSNYLTGVVVTVSGTVPSFGTPTRLAAVVPTYATLTACIAKSDGSLVNVTSGLNIVSVRVSGTTLTPLDPSTYTTQITSMPMYVQDGRVMAANKFFEVAA